ncbi:cytochrome c [Paraburkholderia fungorum]|uniref:cytochrome c n=1 Tax=Paraburkholderia fungorum TaxID=134537 RepID=UPI0038B79616
MTRRNRIGYGLAALACIVLIGAVLFFCLPHGLDPVSPSAAQPTGDALIARGKYLTVAADCAGCHTTEGGKPFAGGLAFTLPFGTIYSPNITPDRENGIGAWSDAEFARAMRSGVGRHGEDLYPAFPYTSYAMLSNDDVLAIRAYLATLAPVDTPAPANALAFPFNQRPIMRGWKLLFLDSKPFAPDPARGGAWNRGAYLVNGLAHCSECHTPRNLMFARKLDEALSGGVVDGWKAWNITPDKETGIGQWTDAQLVSYLSTAYAAGHGAASASMRQAIDLSLSLLPATDIEAIVTYLRTVKPRHADAAAAVIPLSAAVKASTTWSPGGEASDGTGRRIFEGTCASCHGWNGNGRQTAHADLAGSHAVNDPQGANLIRVILEGTSAADHAAATAMPSFGAAYTDAEIAAVANYAIAHFGGKQGQVTPKDVADARP